MCRQSSFSQSFARCYADSGQNSSGRIMGPLVRQQGLKDEIITKEDSH
jgi:hypothetical protein